MTTTVFFKVPAVGTVRELAAFVQARTAEGEQHLLRRIPAEQLDTPDAVELLRIPRALGHAAEVAAFELEDELHGQPVDTNAARLLWRTLLNTAQPFRDHPDVPAGAREALATVDEM
ncbi:hypothetical protein [Streptomyces sp. SAJ15]|uniref:hypothetical protein n=1 Tax=Streptomyces sp. SAJ15 TaxID=2011095 RepID=UPI001186B706|nr:hypothetical protein [Streptomyces sp. SAJ15]TVL88499.1 hypothetical protein CD790_31165 [Streptomyces sp. SAJ15]